ncbi:pectinesterase family protein [Botrimarina sp.]|uniref:pectinesterase family protein n=1 Tax=Botrimarina sp. TaxID=2795802 RepID=UPI0032EAA45E
MRAPLCALCIALLLVTGRAESTEYDAVVAADGSGDYTDIESAIMAAPYRVGGPRWVIRVKPGRYEERVYVQRERGNIRLVGDHPQTTVLTAGWHAGMPGPDGEAIGTFRTPTLQIDGDRFVVENLTIENSAGPVGQAVALRADGDKLVFRNCRFLGWQDTVLLNRGRQYFKDCRIEGDVDFIFGGAAAFFEDCRLHCRDDGYLTAASTPQEQRFGFVFKNCQIDGASGAKAYLGRPWRKHAMTCFVDCTMTQVVRPEGWHNWGDPSREATVRYGEHGSSGAGGDLAQRVEWAERLTQEQASALTAAAVLGGDDRWDPAAEGAAAVGWSDAQAVLDRIQPPTFPDRDFPITDFGAAKGEDGSDAIQAAIDACHAAGGGRVVVPEGEWLTTALRLRSNVNLHVSGGATLRWLFEPSRYPIVFTRWEGMECMNYSPLVYCFEEENVAITGSGTLDGGATYDTWWAWNIKGKDTPSKQIAARDRLVEMTEESVPVRERVFGEGSYLRPNFIQTYRCRNVLIEGVTLNRSPMWNLHPVLSENVTVRGVSVVTHGSNNDGCNPESSRDVLIEGCLFDTGDDCIAIKSGRNNDGRRVGVPCENVIVRDCTMKDGHGGVVLGSECSGNIRNVFVENCRMDSPNLDRALRFKNNAVRGGVLENVFMRDVRIGRLGEAVLTIDLLYEEGPNGDYTPVVRNVQLERVTSSASPRVCFIRGFEGATVDDIRFKDCDFTGITETEVVEFADRLSFENVRITPDEPARSLNSPTAAGGAPRP